MGIKLSKTDVQIEEDPFLRLGYGLNAYFMLMVKLLSMMVFCTILVLPFLYLYQSYEGLSGSRKYYLAKYSLGNIGGASTGC